MGEGIVRMQEIYLDNHSATRPSDEILNQMRSFEASYWACSSAPYYLGQLSHLPVVTAVKKLYELVGANEADQFFFRASLAESIDEIFLSTYFTHVKETGRSHFYSTDLQQAPIMFSLKKMEKLGCSAKSIAVNRFGQLTKQALEEALRPKAAMVSLSLACGLTGVLQPVHEIAEVCKQRQVLLHIDATHAIGKYFFRFEDLPIDFMTFDAAAFHGPKGCAGTFVKALSPFSSQLPKIGTEPSAHICILAEAFELAAEQFDKVCTETARLRDRLESNIEGVLQDAIAPFKEAERLPTTSVLCFPGVASEALLYMISSKGVYATMGGGSFQKLSAILQPCLNNKDLSLGALSFTLSHQTTEQEIDKASQIIIEAYKQLRAISGPTWKGGVV
jgi:cysteine desulfurase